MKKITLLKTLLTIAIVSILGFGANAQTTVTYTFSEHYGNEAEIEEADFDANIHFTPIKGTSSNAPKYYTNGEAARFYQKNNFTLAPKNGAIITEIVIVGGKRTGDLEYKVDEGANFITLSDVKKVYTLSGLAVSTKIEFKTKGTGSAAQVHVKSIAVTYTTGTAPTAAPTFSPAGGTYTSAQSVELASTTADAKIYYTTDGTEPTNASSLYTGAIPVNSNTTIKAIAYDASDANPSIVVTEDYVIDLTPVITADPTTVSLSAEINTAPVTQDITVTAVNLTADISTTISGADASHFTVTPSTIAQTGGNITVTYTPTVTAATHTATLTLKSTGATDVTITLNGESKEPLTLTGDGTKAKPYTVADVIALNNSLGTAEKYWIIGYIVGDRTTTGTGANLEAPFSSGTALSIADNANETDIEKIIPIELPKGTIRTNLNLLDNPDNHKKRVKLYGTLEKYFSVPGMKNTSDYELPPFTGVNTTHALSADAWSANGKVMFNATAGESIALYNTAGQLVISSIASDGLNTLQVNTQGVFIIKVANRVSKVIL